MILIAAVVAALYATGRLDPLLYRFGLNHNPCTHTPSGSIVCGPDVAGTPFNANQPASPGPAGNPAGAAKGVGQSVSSSAAGSAQSVP
ncbi:MAG TPA: hypothetical protein VFP55_07350 [Solirubrobacteraceae bacterium]|nr:hypothetical protein [Solirubrobacteraceae bacterium]